MNDTIRHHDWNQRVIAIAIAEFKALYEEWLRNGHCGTINLSARIETPYKANPLLGLNGRTIRVEG